MADVKFRTTRVILNTSSGTQDITISGFGTPSAAICILSAVSADDTVTDNMNMCLGFTDGTRNSRGYVDSRDGVATSNCHRRADSGGMAILYDGTTVLNAFSFNAWVTDGIQIDITNSSATPIQATFILIGGADVTNAYANVKTLSSASVDNTDPGFEPDLVFTTGVGNASTAQAAHSIYSMGISHNDGTDANKGLFFYDVNASATSNVGSYLSTSKCCGQVFNGAVSWLGAIDNYDSSGFTFTSTASPSLDMVSYLALKFSNSPDIKIFNTDGPTTTGNKAYTDAGFLPDFGLQFMSDTTSSDTLQNSGQDSFAAYAFDADNDFSNAASSQDAVSTMNTASLSSSGKIKDLDSGTSILHEGTLSGFDSTGWTFNFTTAPGTARKWIGLAVGSAGAVGGLVVQSLSVGTTLTLPSLAQHNALSTDNLNVSTVLTDPSLAQNNALLSDSLAVSTQLTEPTITQQNILVVDDLASSTLLTQPVIIQHNSLSVDDLSTATAITEPSLSIAGALSVANLSVGSQLTDAGLTQHNILVVDSLAISTSLSNASLAGTIALSVNDLAVGATITQPTLDAVFAILADNLAVGTSISESSFAQHNVLLVDDMTVDTLLSIVSFGGAVISCLSGYVTIQPVLSGDTTINPTLGGDVKID